MTDATLPLGIREDEPQPEASTQKFRGESALICTSVNRALDYISYFPCLIGRPSYASKILSFFFFSLPVFLTLFLLFS